MGLPTAILVATLEPLALSAGLVAIGPVMSLTPLASDARLPVPVNSPRAFHSASRPLSPLKPLKADLRFSPLTPLAMVSRSGTLAASRDLKSNLRSLGIA